MTLAKDLADKTLARIIEHYGLREHGDPYMTLKNQMNGEPVGPLRVFSGGPVSKLVYCGMTVPFIGLDSHMIYAFTAPDGAVPHFTLDSVCNGDTYAFHLDLTPRVDLGAHLDYINAVFQPLSETFAEARSLEGLSPAHISPRQYALMSPWMLVYRATPAAFAQVNPFVERYLEHWFGLVENGPPPETYADTTPESRAARDVVNRQAIFSPEVDPVWAQVDRLVGAEVSAQQRAVMMSQEIQ
jgi:hypothetical protein